MKSNFSIAFILIFLLSSMGCTSEQRSSEDFLELEEISTSKSVDNEGRKVESYRVASDSLSYECFSRKGKSGTNEENILYVDFRIRQLKNQNDFFNTLFLNEFERQSLVEELQFRGIEKFALVSDSDTIAPHIYHFETSHGLSPFVTFLLGFDLTELNESNYELNFGHPKFEGGKKIKVKL